MAKFVVAQRRRVRDRVDPPSVDLAAKWRSGSTLRIVTQFENFELTRPPSGKVYQSHIQGVQLISIPARFSDLLNTSTNSASIFVQRSARRLHRLEIVVLSGGTWGQRQKRTVKVGRVIALYVDGEMVI